VIDARALAGRTFRSLHVRNYRLYFFGQIVSLTGTWMQSVAQAWLVLQLSHSGLALGLTTALQFGPMLVGGPWGGVIADRSDRRRLGGLAVATRGRVSGRLLAGAALAFGVALWLAAIAPDLGLEMAVMVPVGAASAAFIATSNSLLQLGASQEMRGRVMALFSVVFVGSTPIGGPLVGWIAETFGPREALAIAATATLGAGIAAWTLLRRTARRARPRSAEQVPEPLMDATA
jgi:MFS family permease